MLKGVVCVGGTEWTRRLKVIGEGGTRETCTSLKRTVDSEEREVTGGKKKRNHSQFR